MNPSTIVHFHTGIGNFVLFSPVLKALAMHDPTGKVDLCVDDNWSDPRKNGLISLFMLLPIINKVYTLSEVIDKDYRIWFWTMWTSHGKSREVFESKHSYVPPKWDQNVMHESDYYFMIAQKFYGISDWKPTQIVVPGSSPVLEKKRRIGLCNGGWGDISVFKNWPHFGDLASRIKSFYNGAVEVVKIGLNNELNNVEADQDFVGKLTLAQTAKVIQQCDLLITTDTGNMHIADAIGTPMVVLWGGSSVPKNRPIYAMAKIVSLGLPCQPCHERLGYRDCEKFSCINDITVGEIMLYIRQFYNEGSIE
jgi:ADP-heptose:LPS heptosyltransferase